MSGQARRRGFPQERSRVSAKGRDIPITGFFLQEGSRGGGSLDVCSSAVCSGNERERV